MTFPSLDPLSWVAVAVMAIAIAAGYSKRISAVGALLLANVVVFVITAAEPATHTQLALHSHALLAMEPAGFLQLLTSMFTHAEMRDYGILHLLGNMIFLWAFGVPFEERIGARRFMTIYLVSGLIGSVAQVLAFRAEGIETSMVGASGAVFGIMCAFAARYPNQVIGVPVPLFIILIRIPMRVVYGALFWVGLDVLQTIARDPASNVGHYAHLAGGTGGVILAMTMLRHVVGGPGRTGPVAIDLVALGDFAHDGKTQEVLAHMRQNHDEPEVFQAWLDRFFRSATCPTCKHRVMPKHLGEVVCTQGHRFDVRQDKKTKLASTA